MEAVDVRTNVHFDNITLVNDTGTRGDAMDYFIVDRNTGTARKSAIAKKRRFCPGFFYRFPNNLIDFTCGDPRPDSTSRSGACPLR